MPMTSAGTFGSTESEAKVDSTSDKRVINNTVRHKYRQLSDKEKEQMGRVKDLGLEFIEYLDTLPGRNTREMQLAKTRAEEAVMWAVKDITK
mgnify:CR=1 FL=1